MFGPSDMDLPAFLIGDAKASGNMIPVDGRACVLFAMRLAGLGFGPGALA